MWCGAHFVLPSALTSCRYSTYDGIEYAFIIVISLITNAMTNTQKANYLQVKAKVKTLRLRQKCLILSLCNEEGSSLLAPPHQYESIREQALADTVGCKLNILPANSSVVADHLS